MLRVIQNSSAAGAKSYYSKSDYYSEGLELVGNWQGKGAELLGLSGHVDKESFDRLCDNLHPKENAQLTKRTRSERTVGYDFNFHCPKSVSLAQIFGDTRIVTVFQDAVRETMLDIERDAQVRVRKFGQDKDRTAGNLVWAEFTHFTSRPVDGVPDPLLHSHCFVFNAVYDSVEQQWKAGQFKNLKRDAPYYEALFHVRLADKLKGLGYGITRERKGWEITGVTKEMIDKFSRRKIEIEALAEAKGISDPKEKDELGAKSRRGKDEIKYTPNELLKIWHSRLTPSESLALETLLEHKTESCFEPNLAQKMMNYAIDHHFERASVVPMRALLRTALRRGVGQIKVEDIEHAASYAGLLTKEREGRLFATTAAVLAEERAILKFARETRGTCSPFNRSWTLERDWLNASQISITAHLLRSSDRVQILKGRAGTGKTTLLLEVVSQIERGGHEVFAFAPTAEASRGVMVSEGFKNADTVDRLLVDKSLQSQIENQVLLIDEAGLLSTKQLREVFDVAEQKNCRVILSGDWTQHGSVERGAALRLLADHAGIKSLELKSIQRQKGEYREAVNLLSKGRLADGFDKLDGLGWIKEIEDESRYEALATEYVASVRKNLSTLVISPTHAESEKITSVIREKLKVTFKDKKKTRPLLSSEEKTFTRLQPKNLTAAEKSDTVNFEAGDVVQFVKPAKGRRTGERHVITSETRSDLMTQSDRFQVYSQREIKLAAGDWLRVTMRGETKDGHRLNNGALYQLQGFTKAGDLRLNNGWIIDKDFGHIAHGFCITSHASQGKTVDHVIVAQAEQSLAASNAQQYYVSISRGRQRATVFTDDKEKLRDAISRSNDRMLASDLMPTKSVLDLARDRFQRWVKQWRQREAERLRYFSHQRETARERILSDRANLTVKEQQYER